MTSDTTESTGPTYLLEEGMTINDKWEILNFIAKGGKGEVYLARQLNLDRQVALKIMSMEFIKSLEDDEEEINSEIMRFRREVHLMARMQHPNILQVYDFDQMEIDGTKMDYIVMEYIPGQTLRQKMPENGFAHDEAKVKKWIKNYFFPILDGMKAVHEKGIVHRDMKPENVLIADGPPKIMDFGIAGGYHMDNVTQDHHMLGTINYMPEEQFMDLALTDARVDVYALGKILYEVIEGKLKKGKDKPFSSVSLNKPKTLFFKTLDRIIQQATDKDRNKRIPSVKNFHDSLKEIVMDFNEGTSHKKMPGNHSHSFWKYLLTTCVIVVLIFASAVKILYYPENKLPGIKIPAATSMTLPEFKFKRPISTKLPGYERINQFPGKLFASDNMTMILLKGGKASISFDDPTVPGGKQIEKIAYVKPFYMDRTKITNYLYVKFLNKVDGIEVKNKLVSRNGHLLLLLGEVREGYEPIMFKNNHFTINPEDVSKPVVRVTPVGALAYAEFYGKSIPSMKQWWYAVQAPLSQTPQQNSSTVSSSMMDMMNGTWELQDKRNDSAPLRNPSMDAVIQPVDRTTATVTGIFGLEQNVNEWTISIVADGSTKFHIHGGVGESSHRKSYLERQLWEAFSSVGFRTVLNLNEKK